MQRNKIAKLNNIKKILLKYRTLLERDNFPVEKIILYGSYAKGNFKSYSDIDVCVISDKFSKNKDFYETYLWKKILDFDSRIEPVGYDFKSFIEIDPLVNEIKKHGIEIK